ncbi:MAG: nitroreductase family protein [Anaerolineae bacterium]|nr:nitroreductase family protein [Anaerolineae bacterium]
MGAKPGLIGFARSMWRILADRPQIPPSLEDNPALAVVLNRRSVRRFARTEIPGDVFAAILEAGRLAPSTVNLQTWSLAVFTPALWQETFGRRIPFGGARAVMVMGDTHRVRLVLDAFPHSPMIEYTIAVMNASLAAMSMNIAAEALGVSSVMLSETGQTGLLDAGYLRDKLGLPGGVFPILTIVLGYPRGSYPPMPPKLPLEQICFEGRYREPGEGMMEDWLAQMKAGYRASHPLSSFDTQLGLYISKIDQAEATLQAMVFPGRPGP